MKIKQVSLWIEDRMGGAKMSGGSGGRGSMGREGKDGWRQRWAGTEMGKS